MMLLHQIFPARTLSTTGSLGWTVLVACLLMLVSGCGDGRPERVPVSGQVLFDGEPLTHGFVQVVPENQRAATGTLDAEGRFQLTTYYDGETSDGCVLGTHRVSVASSDPKASPHEIRWLIPPRYADFATSGLTVTVNSPTDALVIRLTSDDWQPETETMVIEGDVDPASP